MRLQLLVQASLKQSHGPFSSWIILVTAAAERASARRRQPTPPADGAVRISMSPLIAAAMLGGSDDGLSGILADAITAQPTAAAQTDAQMCIMKLEGYRLFGRSTGETTVSLQKLMPEVALPETLCDVPFLVPQSHLTLSGDQDESPLVTAAQLTSFVQKVQQDSLVSMQPEKPPSWSGVVRVGTVGLGSQGMLSMLVLLDEQQAPWTVFIRTQQADDSTATTVKHVVCSLEDDLSGLSTLPQISPAAWADWHRGADDVPTVPVQAIAAAAAEKSAKLPFDRVVYMYVSNGTLSPAEESTLSQADMAGHPWLEHTVIYPASIRKDYFSSQGVWSKDALRHAMFDRLQRM